MSCELILPENRNSLKYSSTEMFCGYLKTYTKQMKINSKFNKSLQKRKQFNTKQNRFAFRNSIKAPIKMLTVLFRHISYVHCTYKHFHIICSYLIHRYIRVHEDTYTVYGTPDKGSHSAT